MGACRIIDILLLTLLSVTLFGQSKSELETQKRKTQEQIRYTNQLLKQTKQERKDSYNNLLLINKNISTRMELIAGINSEIEYTDRRIADNVSQIELMQSDLERLQTDYARMLRIAWKNRDKQNVLMFILSSGDFNRSYLRLKYMQQVARHRKRQFRAINALKSELEAQVRRLDAIRREKTALLAEERVEEENLRSEQQVQQAALAKLKHDEAALKRKLYEHEKQARQIQAEIAKLIAEEARRTSGSATGSYKLTPAEQLVSTDFGNNKGRLPWPVARGVISVRFGKQPHPVIKNVVIDNKGIDISTTTGSEARAVFNGEVRKIFRIPGGQHAIIIRHGEYLSVYTHIDDVYVAVGEQVKSKQAIGKIHTDDTDNKTVVHLEIWKGQAVLNPALWLAK